MARILVIDDDAPFLDMLAISLRTAGHIVMTASNGRLALDLFRKEPADLVITDIIMPDQDGVGVAMILRKEFPDVAVIAMSGGVTRSPFYLEVMKKLGARCLLAKPFAVGELLNAVSQVLATKIER